VATLYKCMCKTGGRYLPAFALWRPLGERLQQCASHFTMEEKVQQHVHWFLFPSEENWCWNLRNAAGSFRRVLPKSIKDIWMVLTFQKRTPILWRRPPPRQAFHLPHQGDRSTCARNHSCWPTSDYQRGCRRS